MSIESCVEKITGSVRSRFQSRSALRDLGRLLAVDGEVVVGEEDGAVPVAVERIRLRENLRDRLVANAAAQIHDDVAELALERATATRLDDTDRVPAVAQQVDARRRRKGEVDLLGLAVVIAVAPGPEVLEERGPGELGLAGEENVGIRATALGAERRDGPPIATSRPRSRNIRASSIMRRLWLT